MDKADLKSVFFESREKLPVKERLLATKITFFGLGAALLAFGLLDLILNFNQGVLWGGKDTMIFWSFILGAAACFNLVWRKNFLRGLVAISLILFISNFAIVVHTNGLTIIKNEGFWDLMMYLGLAVLLIARIIYRFTAKESPLEESIKVETEAQFKPMFKWNINLGFGGFLFALLLMAIFVVIIFGVVQKGIH